MTRTGRLPPVLAAALRSPGGTCYRHCDRPIRSRGIRSSLPGLWSVRACPAGVVSLVLYSEWTGRNTVPDVRAELKRRTFPPSLVRAWDLRVATRHGPELGRAAERSLARARRPRGIRVVYWRVYPFRVRDGSERRLYACFRRSHPSPVFFVSDPSRATPGCPACARAGSSGGRGVRRSAR